MFSMGGGPGGITGGPSSMASNAAAGLPAADVPGELRAKVEKVLENEPEHVIPNVGWRVDVWDREPFSLLRFLRPHRWRSCGSISPSRNHDFVGIIGQSGTYKRPILC